MQYTNKRLCAAIAAAGIALTAGLPARAAEPMSEDAAVRINAVRSQVVACGGPVAVMPGAASPVTPMTSTGSHESDAPPPLRAPLAWNAKLAAAAQQHARAMADQGFFDHVGPDGRRAAQRVDATGYRWTVIGENLAAGHATLEAALAGWLKSDGHCRNLLDTRFAEFGLARVEGHRPDDRFRVYWAIVFGRQARQLEPSVARY